MHLGYRLAGLTLFPLAPSKTGVRFDTVYKGQFLEQYYLILHATADDRMSVHRHTLPCFVPLSGMCEGEEEGEEGEKDKKKKKKRRRRRR